MNEVATQATLAPAPALKAVLVGEAWGEREALFTHGFVGPSGRELMRLLSTAGLVDPLPIDPRTGREIFPSELDMIHLWKKARAERGIGILNTFNAHPPFNDLEKAYFGGKADDIVPDLPPLAKGKYLLRAHFHHLEALWADLRALRPNLIIALGNTACWATLGQGGVTTLRGTVQMSERLGIKVLPTFHPAAILRMWSNRPILSADLNKAARQAEFPEIRRTERWLLVAPTLAEIAEWITRPADLYAVDIETAFKTITMIGFARSTSDALVVPFFDPLRPDYSFWPTPGEEVQARKMVQHLLGSPVPKVMQNGIYDVTFCVREGFRPRNCLHDTMLLHHAAYPELQKGLGFLGSVYCDEIAWKPMGKHKAGDMVKRDE